MVAAICMACIAAVIALGVAMSLVWELPDRGLLVVNVVDDDAADRGSDGRGSAASRSYGSRIRAIPDTRCIAECPIEPADTWFFYGSYLRAGRQVWRYQTADDVMIAGKHVIDELFCLEGDMVTSGYLDLSNKAWGCVFAPDSPSNSSITVSMIPRKIGEDVGPYNMLEIKIIMVEGE